MGAGKFRVGGNPAVVLRGSISITSPFMLQNLEESGATRLECRLYLYLSIQMLNVWPLQILPFQVSLILCRAAECNNSPCLRSFSFQEEEMQDPELDYKLRRSCKKMIKV